MKVRISLIRALLICVPLLIACKRDPYTVDISSVRLSIEIRRLEKDMFSLEPSAIKENVQALKVKYGTFLTMFSSVINTGDINDPSFGDFLAQFCTDRLNNEVYSRVMEMYPDVIELKSGLEKAFRHYLYYFPGKSAPSVITCITGFNSSIIAGDSVLGIGLDRYLGSDCKYYPQLQIYKYLAARMNPRNIIPDCMYAWAASEWPFDSIRYASDNVLSHIIHEGKLKYFQRCMLPQTGDTLIFGFNKDQMTFCNNNESQMWVYLVENDLLFSTDQFTIRKLTGEAPFTTYFTNESPGRAAVWLGFRIVESYMLKNPDVELRDLMTDGGVQKILEKAKYNPR